MFLSKKHSRIFSQSYSPSNILNFAHKKIVKWKKTSKEVQISETNAKKTKSILNKTEHQTSETNISGTQFNIRMHHTYFGSNASNWKKKKRAILNFLKQIVQIKEKSLKKIKFSETNEEI